MCEFRQCKQSKGAVIIQKKNDDLGDRTHPDLASRVASSDCAGGIPAAGDAAPGAADMTAAGRGPRAGSSTAALAEGPSSSMGPSAAASWRGWGAGGGVKGGWQ